MKILMIANFVFLPSENSNSRFTYLLNNLKNYEVELITSNFSHIEKKHRTIENEKVPYKITLLNEPGYEKNISLKRFYSHFKLSKNLKTYLNNLKKNPDVIYCAVPSLDVAKEAAKYARKNGVRFIIDVQDLWPEAFKMIVNIPIISDMAFYPMKKIADYIYKTADDIVAVSETYANRVAKVNKKYNNKLVVFLGTDLLNFDKVKKYNKITFNDNKIRIVYIGTLGASYDICSIIDAIKILKTNGNNNIKFIVIGDGPLRENFEKYAELKDIDCEFTGMLNYEKMISLLCACDIAVNPIIKQSAASIINKVGDYAAAGLPVINTQESEEYQDLLKKYDAGFNCINGDINDISKKMDILVSDQVMAKQMGKNNRRLAEEKFDRKKTYEKIIQLILLNK